MVEDRCSRAAVDVIAERDEFDVKTKALTPTEREALCERFGLSQPALERRSARRPAQTAAQRKAVSRAYHKLRIRWRRTEAALS